MEATIKFLPAIPFPVPFDVQQHTNIKAAIKLYEDGKIDGVEHVFIIDGKVVPEKEIFTRKAWSWSEEGRWQQFAQKHTYGHGPFGVNFHEVSIVRK
jgi:hypothetical protein